MDTFVPEMEVHKDAFGNHLCIGKYGCIASFNPHQWDCILQAVAKELIADQPNAGMDLETMVRLLAAG